MKHKLLKLLSFLGLFTILVNTSQLVKADEVDYDIENNTARAEVNTDGSLTMMRRITYKFVSGAHGVYYTQALDEGQKILGLKVEVRDNNGSNKATESFVNELYYGKNRIKVFHQVEAGNRLTVTYRYQITRAVTNYRDVAELNFMIIGNNWDTDLDHVKASVIFPGPVKDLKAWAHGPLSGHIAVLPKKGKIVMTVDDLDGDKGLEVHTIFPLSVTPKNKNVVDKNHRQAVLKQEAILAQEANRKRQRNQLFEIVLLVLSAATGIFAIFKGFMVKKEGVKPTKESQLAHNYELPDVDPVSAQVLDRGTKPDSRAFTAYLMQLAAQKKVKIEDYKERRKTYYRITLLDTALPAQEKVLDTLFNEVGDGQSFTTQQLKNYYHRNLGKSFDEWVDQHYDAVKDQSLLSTKAEEKRKINQTLIIFLMVVNLVAAGFAVVIFNQHSAFVILSELVIIILAITAFILSTKRISIYTGQGAEETNKVRGFKKMLGDIGRFKMRDVGDLILWQDIMPYAVAFNLAKKVLKELKIEFSDEELAQGGFNFYGPFYSSDQDGFASSFNSSFTAGISSGSSSISGGSGGFSGGSSGGFGGGSGGGAF